MLANLIHGPSYISLEYALSHGLIPERVSTVTSVALGRSRKFDTPVATFTSHSLALPCYAVGADLVVRASSRPCCAGSGSAGSKGGTGTLSFGTRPAIRT